MPATHNFSLYRGNGLPLKVGPIRQQRGRALVDMTGRSQARFVMRVYARAPEIAFEADGEVVEESGEWFVLVPMPKAETLELEPGDYAYAVEVSDPPESVITLGIVRVLPNVIDTVE